MKNLTLASTPADLERGDLILHVPHHGDMYPAVFCQITPTYKSYQILPIAADRSWRPQPKAGKLPYITISADQPVPTQKFEDCMQWVYSGVKIIPYPVNMLTPAQEMKYREIRKLLGL